MKEKKKTATYDPETVICYYNYYQRALSRHSEIII